MIRRIAAGTAALLVAGLALAYGQLGNEDALATKARTFEQARELHMIMAERGYTRSVEVIKLRETNQPHYLIAGTGTHNTGTRYDIEWESHLNRSPNDIWDIGNRAIFVGSDSAACLVTASVRLFLDTSQFVSTDQFAFIVFRVTGTTPHPVFPNDRDITAPQIVSGGAVHEIAFTEHFPLPDDTNFKYVFVLISAKHGDNSDINLEGEAQLLLNETHGGDNATALVGMNEVGTAATY